MEESVRTYLEAIPAEHRPMFDHVHRLITETRPEATLSMSYGMPTYRIGRQRLYVGMWKHGLSLYGWGHERDGGFLAAHPELLYGKGTIRLRAADLTAVGDEALVALVRAALAT